MRPLRKDFKTNGDFNRATDTYIDGLENEIFDLINELNVIVPDDSREDEYVFGATPKIYKEKFDIPKSDLGVGNWEDELTP